MKPIALRHWIRAAVAATLLSAGCEGTTIDGTLSGTRNLTGTVDRTAFHLSGAQVFAISRSGHTYRAEISPATGRFSIQLPVGETYQLRFANATRNAGVFDAFAILTTAKKAGGTTHHFVLRDGPAYDLGKIARGTATGRGALTSTSGDDADDADDVDDDSDHGMTGTSTAGDDDADDDDDDDGTDTSSTADDDPAMGSDPTGGGSGPAAGNGPAGGSGASGDTESDDDVDVCDVAGGSDLADAEAENDPADASSDADADDDQDDDDGACAGGGGGAGGGSGAGGGGGAGGVALPPPNNGLPPGV